MKGPLEVISMFKPQLTLHSYGSGRGCSLDMNGTMPQILLPPQIGWFKKTTLHNLLHHLATWYLILGVPWPPTGATGVPSRMNVGQIFENLLGSAGRWNGEEYRVGAFDEMFSEEASRGAEQRGKLGG